MRWMKAEPSSTSMMLPKAQNEPVAALTAMLLYMPKMPELSVNAILHTLTGTNVKGRTNLLCTYWPKKSFRKRVE